MADRSTDNSHCDEWVAFRTYTDRNGNANTLFGTGTSGNPAHGHVVETPSGEYLYVRDPNGDVYIDKKS